MNIKLTNDSLLNLMELQITEANLAHLEKVKSNTKNFEKIAKHIVALNDFFHHHHGFVTLSSTKDYFKIKFDEKGSSTEFHNKVSQWSEKYKVELEAVPDKDVYYILGGKE